jgi:hypothetical protein
MNLLTYSNIALSFAFLVNSTEILNFTLRKTPLGQKAKLHQSFSYLYRSWEKFSQQHIRENFGIEEIFNLSTAVLNVYNPKF